MGRYQYQSLPGPQYIRLLQLHQGADNDPISIVLHTHSIDHLPRYEAVSYVWGDAGITRRIYHGTSHLDITVNLHGALTQFRQPDAPRLLWADAVCINQEDVRERETQVRIMHSIYRSCRRCLVWLGLPDEHSSTALQVIGGIAALVAWRKSIAVEQLDDQLKDHGRDMTQATELGFNTLPPPYSRAWDSVFRFLHRPWFSRVWVIQEVFFAQDVLFFCGYHTLRYAALYHASDWAIANYRHIDWMGMGETGSHQSRTINIMNMRDYFGRQNRPLHAILDQVKRFGAADPRDKMWALLNFPEFQREAPDLAPSYDITPSEAYAAVTLATIRYSGNLHVLTRVDREANLLVEPFSSWIPRWDCKDVAPNVWPTSYGQFSAGTSSSAPRLNLHVLAGNILKLGGVQFDVVEDVSCIDCAGYNASPPLKPKFLSKREWERYTEPSEEPYPTSAAITEAYAMTLTAGHHEYQGSNVVPASRCVQKHVVEFIAWLQWLREEHGANEDSRIPKECHYPPGFYSETRPFLPESNLKTIAEHAMHFHDMVRFYSCYQTLFRTKRGYLGMGSYGPRPGDLVCVFFGGALPFILRQRNGGDGYELVGSAYVHGVMNGEAIDMFHKGKLSAQSFDIH